jgi:hypothetical protein
MATRELFFGGERRGGPSSATLQQPETKTQANRSDVHSEHRERHPRSPQARSPPRAAADRRD